MKPKVSYDDSYSEPIVARAGSKLTLHTQIDGVPTPKVKWSISGQPAEGVTDVTTETEDGASRLVAANVTSALAGKVTIVAENSVGADEAVFDVVVKGTCVTSSPLNFLQTDVLCVYGCMENMYMKQNLWLL